MLFAHNDRERYNGIWCLEVKKATRHYTLQTRCLFKMSIRSWRIISCMLGPRTSHVWWMVNIQTPKLPVHPQVTTAEIPTSDEAGSVKTDLTSVWNADGLTSSQWRSWLSLITIYLGLFLIPSSHLLATSMADLAICYSNRLTHTQQQQQQ